MGSVAVISPEGEQGNIPVANLAAAQARGFKPAVQMTSPEGETGWIPRENAAAAMQRGFKVGQSAPAAPGDSRIPLTSYAKATAQGLADVGEGVMQAGEGLVNT